MISHVTESQTIKTAGCISYILSDTSLLCGRVYRLWWATLAELAPRGPIPKKGEIQEREAEMPDSYNTKDDCEKSRKGERNSNGKK